jgi:hypothetical protein
MPTLIEERVEKILSEIKISHIFPEATSSSHVCPSCGKRGKFYQVGGDKLAKCYSSSCEFNITKNVINSYKWKHRLTYYEAIVQLEQHFGLTTVNIVPQRSKVLEQCLDIYQHYLWSEVGKEALNYLRSRGFLDEIIKQEKLGFAPHTSSLRKFDFSIEDLKNEGLLYEDKEFYSKRIILPIRDGKGNLVHLNGRYVGAIPKSANGEDLCGRYKETKSMPGVPSSKSLLGFENLIPEYLTQTDTLIISEGYLDGLSLIQLGIPAVSSFGLEKISSHYSKFNKFKNLIFMFDNDTYDVNHPKYPLEYKSWIRILPQLIDLQIALPKVNFYICMVPLTTRTKTGILKPTKDINDWLNASKLTSTQTLNYINSHKRELISSLISKWGSKLEHHLTLLRLINITNRVDLKQDMEKYINPTVSILDYALNLVSA